MRRAVAECTLLAALCVLVVGWRHLVPGSPALGWPTRDLYDHLALLDAWATVTPGWRWPEGGVLLPPDPQGMLIGVPFLPGDRALAWNAGLVARLWLAAVGAWLLARRLGGSGLVAGVAYGLSPFLLGQALTGEAETLSVWPFPVALWLLLDPRPGARALAGVLAAVGALSSWYYAVFLATLLAGHLVLVDRSRRGLVAPGVFAVLVAGPAAAYQALLRDPREVFRGPDMGVYLAEHPGALIRMVSDPAAWLGGGAPGVAHVDHLGVVIVPLAVAGALRWAGRWPWLGLLAAALALALGPVLVVGGELWSAWTPYRLLLELPLFDLMRLPHRWLALATLALAVLASFGARGAAWPASLLVVVDTAWFAVPQRPVTPVTPPSGYLEAVRGPVVDLPPRTLGPLDLRGLYLVWQREHGHPVPYSLSMTAWGEAVSANALAVAVAAADSRDSLHAQAQAAQVFRQGPFAERVASARGIPTDRHTLLEGAVSWRRQGFRQVVLHTWALEPADAAAALELLAGVLGPAASRGPGWVSWDL